ncbi:MAG: hypothetical protein GY854_04015 [Deltaproteobacteria bacterium]|nr:hypothetical protein [Deltaproteobacteria bacterium]
MLDNHKHRRNISATSSKTDRLRIHEILARLGTRVDPAAAENRTLQVLEDEIEVDVELSLKHWDLSPGRYTRLTVGSADFKSDISSACLIFEPFFCGKASDDGNEHDLAWVYKTVTRCNGSIAVRNDPRGGTTFEVFLPIEQKSTKSITELPDLVSTCVHDIVHQFSLTA